MDPSQTAQSANECQIFMAALDIEAPEQRSAYLDQACGGDAALRQRVELLLQHHTRADEFLETPAVSLQDATGTIEESAAAGSASAGLPHSDRTDVFLDDDKRRLDFLAPSDDPTAVGCIGQYAVTQVIGRGGMGIVLKARDASLNRVVTIKVLAPELAGNPTARKRFLREARAAAAVVHQHVVTIHAVAEGQPPYLVMEYVDGQSLQEKIDAAGPLELKETLRIGVQVAAGLAAAHAHGVIHRDIKPSNILLENGVERVRITDFGLARAADDVEITRPGEVAGTPQYMSPEQAQGQPVDARSDLFSFGSVLYAMCTGRPPFRAETTIAAIRRVCDDTPRPIREVNPETPAWLTEIIDRLLAKRPEDRYQTAAEVVELLGQHLAQVQHPGSAPRTAIPASAPRGEGPGVTGRANRRWAAAAVILLSTLAALGATEVTGVTHLAGSVVRIVTGEGTLVIEIDDPTVQVALDGEELTISGGGVEQVRLRPGQYQFTATKDGRPVKQELVTITRGGERVVTVSREVVERTTAVPQPSVERGAFVVLGGDGVPERKFDTLAEAVLGASDGDTLEIRGNGPFVTEPITITQALRIRAGDGFRPVIKLSQKGVMADAALLTAEAPLVLEALEFQELGPEARMNSRTVINCWNSLRLANCRFANGADRCVNAFGSSSVCDIRNCEFASLAVFPIAVYGHRLLMDNCLLVGKIGFNSLQGMDDPYGAPPNDGILRLTRNSFAVESFDLNLCLAPSVDPINVVRVQASENIFAGPSVFRIRHESDLVEDALLPTGSTEDILTRLLRWHGERNLYSMRGSFLAVFGFPESVPTIGSMEHWKTFWGSTEAGSVEGVVRFQGGDLVAKVNRAPEELVADDFRQRADSPGYQAGPDGKDLGADIDLVGPGAAYERWKQTPEYQQWLKDSGQLHEAAVTTREPGAFVRLGAMNVPQRRYDNFAEAVLSANEGDTIEVRGNGPFVTQPVTVTRPLTIRAGDGFRPIVQMPPRTPGTLLRSADIPLVLEGIEFRQQAGEDAPAKPTSRVLEVTGGTLQVANCRFVRQVGAMAPIIRCNMAPRAVFHNTEFVRLGTGDGGTINYECQPTGMLHLENCIHVGWYSPLTLPLDIAKAREVTILVRRCTWASHFGTNFLPSGIPQPLENTAGPEAPLLSFKSAHNVFDIRRHFLTFGEPGSAAATLAHQTLADICRRSVAWRDEGSLYPNELLLGIFNAANTDKPPDVAVDGQAAWNRFWNLESGDLLSGTPKFEGGDIYELARLGVERLSADDFRLHADSPGYRAGPGGADLGADIDLVGPGEAYERWKKTPEYQQWLKETGQTD